jgi:hypothetical protein
MTYQIIWSKRPSGSSWGRRPQATVTNRMPNKSTTLSRSMSLKRFILYSDSSVGGGDTFAKLSHSCAIAPIDH